MPTHSMLSRLSNFTSNERPSFVKNTGSLSHAELQQCLHSIKHLDYSEARIEVKKLKRSDELAEVYEAKLCMVNGDRIKVALRQTQPRLVLDGELVKLLARETVTWTGLDHPNIVKIIGYSVLPTLRYPISISGWMENGTVVDYIKKNPRSDIISLIFGIAHGLEYLHSLDIIHSDIKSDNILIDEAGMPHIYGFGLPRVIAESQNKKLKNDNIAIETLQGFVPWMAIELLGPGRARCSYSKEADVWAFGMTIYELLTLKKPYYDKADIAGIVSAITAGVKPSLPEKSSALLAPARLQTLWMTCQICWEDSPIDRPSMHAITKFIAYLVKETRGYGKRNIDAVGPYLMDTKTTDLTESSVLSSTMPICTLNNETSATNLERLAAACYNSGISDAKSYRWRDAMEAMQISVEMELKLVKMGSEHHARLGDSQHCLGLCLSKLCWYDEALVPTRAAIAIRKKLVAEDPCVSARLGLGSSLYLLGDILRVIGSFEEARKTTQEALEIRQELRNEDLGSFRKRVDLGDTYHNLAICLAHLERYDAAIEASRTAVDFWCDEAGRLAVNVEAALRASSNCCDRQKQFDKVACTLRLAIETRTKLAKEFPQSFLDLKQSASCLPTALKHHSCGS